MTVASDGELWYDFSARTPVVNVHWFVVRVICRVHALPLLLTWSWFFFFRQKTAYEMRISDWSSDVCSSDLRSLSLHARAQQGEARDAGKRRAAAKEMEDQSPFGDDLIARPSIQ